MDKGYIQIYTGNGKGKTTAALGLALRAAGCGLRVIIVQFMKGRDSGELKALARLPGVSLYRTTECRKFYSAMTQAEKDELSASCHRMLGRAIAWMTGGEVDLLILDEAMGAIHSGAVATEDILELLDCRPDSVEVVLTGRCVPQALLDRAHLVTEMVPVKHYFDQGVPARKGIEY